MTAKTQTVSLKTQADLTQDKIDLSADLSVNAGGGALIALDIGDRRIAFGPLSSKVSVTGAQTAADWTADVDLASFQTTELRTETVRLNLSGKGADLTPATLTSPFDLSLTLSRLEGLTPQTDVLSGPLTVTGNGSLDAGAQEIDLSELALSASAAALTLTDATLSATRASGQGRLSLRDLAVFSSLAGRDLGGSISGSFAADLDPSQLTGSASASLVSRDLALAVAQADALLAGETRTDLTVDLNGAADIEVKSLTLDNDQLKISGAAHYVDDGLTSSLKADLADLAKVDPQLAGSLELDATTAGPLTALEIKAQAASSQILLAGNTARQTAIVGRCHRRPVPPQRPS